MLGGEPDNIGMMDHNDLNGGMMGYGSMGGIDGLGGMGGIGSAINGMGYDIGG